MSRSWNRPYSAISYGSSPGGGKRPRCGTADRPPSPRPAGSSPERWSAFGVVPDTLKRWRRQLEVRKDPRRRRGPGRSPIDPELRQLILRMGRENPRWGYLRIKGELLKLGITVSATGDREHRHLSLWQSAHVSVLTGREIRCAEDRTGKRWDLTGRFSAPC